MITNSSIAPAFFLVIVGVTIAVTVWASLKTRSSEAFYNAGAEISGLQNGLAISAEFTSAASLLGVIALYYTFGADILVFFLSPIIGFAFVLFVMAERYRSIGRFTLGDVLGYYFDGKSIRLFAALSSFTVVIFYLIAQMVGAGKLLELLFGIQYTHALLIVGGLTFLYVTFGGMLATTWVQIIKAVLFVSGLTVVSLLILYRFGFDIGDLVRQSIAAHDDGGVILSPGSFLHSPVSGFSLAAAMVFGVAGLPHILIRFCTVKDAAAARQSMTVATLVIAFVVSMYLVIGLGSIAILADQAGASGGDFAGGQNMIFLHLSHRIGGDLLFGIMSAMVYATILAVVAGLTIAAVSTLAHDIYNVVICDGQATDKRALTASRIASAIVAVLAVLLGLVFENQNIGYMMSLAFAIAASANFPVLILALYWRGLTRQGALAAGYTGLVVSVVLVIAGPTVWSEILHHPNALFPYREPAAFAMIPSFLIAYFVSKWTHEPNALLNLGADAVAPISTRNSDYQGG